MAEEFTLPTEHQSPEKFAGVDPGSIGAHHLVALKEFFRWALQMGPLDGCDVDGGAAQDKAEALGLIVKEKYDPAKHGEQDIDPGDEIFVFAPGLTS